MKNPIIDCEIDRLFGTSSFPAEGQIGFIGPTPGGTRIRDAFRRLKWQYFDAILSDIGNVNFKGAQLIPEILVEMAQDGQQTILCTSQSIIPHLDAGFWESYFNPAVVSNRPLPGAYEIPHIGIQSHLFDIDFERIHHKHLRLGEVRSSIGSTEVILRHADCIIIDLNVLRLSDNLGSSQSLTAGLMIEELCQIAKYAGASRELKTIILNGYDQNQDDHGMMAQNIALLLYYILDGFQIRQREKEEGEQLQRYTVLPDHSAQELIFIEDVRSGRWWVELHSDAAEGDVKMACTREDYEEACNNHISERITSLLALT